MSPSVINLTRAPLARTFGDEAGVPLAVEDHDGEVARRLALGLRDPSQVLCGCRGDVDGAGSLRADGDLVHVHARPGIEHGAAFADRYHSDGIGPAVGGQCGAVDRIDSHVGERSRSVTDPFAVEQHRGGVLLAFADHDDAVHRHGRQHGAHRVHCCLVGTVLVATADPS
jgi:hypothetical protein